MINRVNTTAGNKAPEKHKETLGTFTSKHIVSTPGPLEALGEAKLPARELLKRHFACDWSGCEPEDAEANRQALIDGSRIISVYKLPNTGREIWVITE